MLSRRIRERYLRVRLHSHGINIAVNTPQQIDQCFAFARAKTRKQAALAFQSRNDYGIVFRSAFCSKGNRVGSTVLLSRLNIDEISLLHCRQCSADRPFIEPNNAANSRSGNSWFNGEKRHDPPFGDVHAKFLLVQDCCSSGEFIGDKRHEGGNVAFQIKRLRRPVTLGKSFGRVPSNFGHRLLNKRHVKSNGSHSPLRSR